MTDTIFSRDIHEILKFFKITESKFCKSMYSKIEFLYKDISSCTGASSTVVIILLVVLTDWTSLTFFFDGIPQNAIKTKLNPLFHIADVVIVNELPRTASNKIMRRVLRDNYIANRDK